MERHRILKGIYLIGFVIGSAIRAFYTLQYKLKRGESGIVEKVLLFLLPGGDADPSSDLRFFFSARLRHLSVASQSASCRRVARYSHLWRGSLATLALPC